jgi:hypothetical protein
MSDQQIQPHKVTKPIQLVAAWLAGLILIDAMFLGAAATLDHLDWPHGLLIIASVINVPIFLGAIFLLQTKFRAELQEDSFYAQYLSKRTSQVVRIDKNADQDAKLEALESRLLNLERTTAVTVSDVTGLYRTENELSSDWGEWRVSINILHPQLNDIRNALEKACIPVAEVFGMHKNAEPPSRWVISVSYQIPVELQVKLLHTLMAFDFTGFNRWEPRRDADEYEDVYIGGYGDDPIVLFTPKLRNILDSPAAPKLLDTYCRMHSTDDSTIA